MTSLKLLESFALVKDKYVLEAHKEDITENDMILFESSARHRVSMKKRVWIAVIAAVVLMLAGCIYAVMKLQELKLEENTYTRPVEGNVFETEVASAYIISLQGITGSPEYQAVKEWRSFVNSYNAILDGMGNDAFGFEEKYVGYQVYTQEMSDKLEEIAQKYNLNLHTELNVVDAEELACRVGGEFMGEGMTRYTAYIYEDGTFQFDGDAAIGDSNVSFQCRRTVKGTLDEAVLNIGSVEEYEEFSYQTACGEQVLLESSPAHSLIYADFEECMVLLNISKGSTDGITVESLKKIADAFDFTVLKEVIVPDMRGDSILGTGSDSTEEDEWQEFYIKETERIMMPYKALTEENIDGWADIVTKEKTM